jgi:CRP-like cAMP-binding protein
MKRATFSQASRYGTDGAVRMPEIQTQNALIAALDPSDQELLLRNGTLVDLEHGQEFCRPGSEISYVFFPESGLESLVATTAEGGIVETGVVGIEGAVGLTEVLAEAPFFPLANTQVAGQAWKVPAQDCRAVFSKESRRILLERYAQFLLAEARQSVACQAFHPLDRRLARWLWECYQRAGVGKEIPITHEFMATMLGSRRASVTEALPKLVPSVRTSRGKVIVDDPAALADYACECRGYIDDLRAKLFLR